MKGLRQGERLGLAVVSALWIAFVAVDAQAPAAKSHLFRGRVVSVNAQAGTASVSNENIEGWMAPMTMTYKVENAEVLKQLKAGDTVTATVYDGNFGMLFKLRLEIAVASAADDLPPISYACPSTGETSYVDDKPGKCPNSGAVLEPVRLTIAYSCLKNQIFIREAPGLCPTDRTEMVPITVGMYFTCSNDVKVHEMNPGQCGDGSARTKAFERRPHGDHNSRHGGAGVFMSADQWHHLEGTYVRPNVFRVYLYDDMTRPLKVGNVSGRVIIADSNSREIGQSIALVAGKSPDSSTLEAYLPGTPFPFNVKLWMKFTANDKEQVFDFTFRDYTKEP